jgi:hypothetical protein
MSCTQRKRTRKEHHDQSFKTKAIENRLKNQTFQKESSGKSTQLMKKLSPL